MPPDWLEPRTLTGETLELTALTVQDSAAFVAALGPPQTAAALLAHLSYPAPRNTGEARRIIATAEATADRLPYAARRRDSGELIGTSSFYEINPALRAGHRPHVARPALLADPRQHRDRAALNGKGC